MSETKYRFLSLAEVLAEITIDTDNEDSRDSLVYSQWIYRALRKLTYVKANIKTARVEVCKGTIAIPCDLSQVIGIDLVDRNGFALSFQWHTTGAFVAPTDCQVVLSEQDDQYVLSSNATGCVGAYIRYYAYPVDEKGELLIPEIFLEAIMAFVEWRWWARQRKRKPREASRFDVRDAFQSWCELSAVANAAAKMPNMIEAERIGRSLSTLLPNMGTTPIVNR